MLNHVSIGVRSVEKSKAFYDSVLAVLGYKCLYKSDGALGYGKEQPVFWVNRAEAPVPSDSRSGLHFCFNAPDSGSVRKFHSAGLKAGGKDNGAPGVRTEYGDDYYAAFLVDPEGYRIEAYCAAKV